jgi:hypothetical protein
LFFSTKVEPRTVRAYCTHDDSPIESTSTQNAVSSLRPPPDNARMVPSMSRAMRIAGNVSCTSAARMMMESSAPPA